MASTAQHLDDHQNTDDSVVNKHVLEICECYVNLEKLETLDCNNTCSNDLEEGELRDEEDSENDEEIFDEDDEDGSLVNETGSCEDNDDDLCFWDENMFSKNDSIYQVSLPDTFHDTSGKINKRSEHKPGHRRNKSIHSYASMINSRRTEESRGSEKRKEKVVSWLNSPSNGFRVSKIHEINEDIEKLLESPTNISNFTRKIHPKYAAVSDDNSSSKKRKRVSIMEDPGNVSKKLRSSDKSLLRSITGWICDFFKY